jgi:hypothetical protein
MTQPARKPAPTVAAIETAARRKGSARYLSWLMENLEFVGGANRFPSGARNPSVAAFAGSSN